MPEIRPAAFQLQPRPGEVLRGDLWDHDGVPPDDDRFVAICHGFKGFKDWGFFPFTARRLAEELRCRVVSFNFTGSGIGPVLDSFTEVEAFGRNTFSKETADLAAVLDGLSAGRLGELRLPRAGSIGVLGHSRGGVAAILAAERPVVRAVVTWASISGVERYAGMFEGVPAGEPVPVKNARTGDVLPLYPDVLEDIRANAVRFDLGASLRRSGVPLLVVHGTHDTSVPPGDARELASESDRARLELIEGAGHTFEVGHPFEGPSPELERGLQLTTRHFADHL